MDIAITGATGLLGGALTTSLRADGHRVRPISRRAGTDDTIVWDPAAGSLDERPLAGVDAVVHLAGEGIAARPWSAKQRSRLVGSRVDGTRTLVDALGRMDEPPRALVSASAIGAYGSRGSEVLTETSAPGDDFLADLCRAWEAEASRADAFGIRTALVRTGIVLDRRGGALAKQLPLFRLGLGARAGRGDQWLSWITLRDHVAAVRHLLDADVEGPVNLTAPEPVTNRTFTETVARHLHRPAFLVVPRVVRSAPFGVGPLVDNLLFASQRVRPEVLMSSGFRFRDRSIEDAVRSVLPR